MGVFDIGSDLGKARQVDRRRTSGATAHERGPCESDHYLGTVSYDFTPLQRRRYLET